MDWQTLPLSEILDELPKSVGVALALLLALLGYRKGVKGDEPQPKKEVEIAGAIVDNSAIFKLASAIEAQNILMARSHDHMRQVVDSFNRHSEEVRDLAREIREGITAILRSKH